MIKKRTKYTDVAYIINPITKRKIKVGSATYKKLVKDKIVKPVKIFVDDIDGDEYEEAPSKAKKSTKTIIHKNEKKKNGKPLTKKYKMVMKKDDLGIKVVTKKKVKKNVYDTSETEHEETETEEEPETPSAKGKGANIFEEEGDTLDEEEEGEDEDEDEDDG